MGDPSILCDLTGHPLVEAELVRRGGTRGMPFSRFMEVCLYHPQAGYYARLESPTGKRGDFMTSVSVGPVFGRLLADQLIHWRRCCPEAGTVHLIEVGSHDGQLAVDILQRLESVDLLSRWRYSIIEPLESRRNIQKAHLRGYGYADCVCWLDELNASELDPVFLFSNELIDSLPVERVQFEGARWREQWVTAADPGWRWIVGPEVDDAMLEEIQHWKIPEISGMTTELHLVAKKWAAQIGQRLRNGLVLTIDYGYRAEEYYAPHRKDGTLRGYFRHRQVSHPLHRPGLQDLTVHAPFDLLIEVGQQNGLETIHLQDQHHFLVQAARLGFLREMEQQMQAAVDHSKARKWLQAFQTLMHPESMGTSFHCLLQAKGQMAQRLKEA